MFVAAPTDPARRTKSQFCVSCEETDSEDDCSSSCDSSSSSSTNNDSSSSDSDSDDITSTNNNKKKKGNKAGIIKKKRQIENEFNDLPSIEDLKISVPEVLCDILGKIDKVVEQLVIVKPNSGKPTLHIDTVLFVEKGERALGKILDVFGPVSEPNYCIRFNSPEHIQESNIKEGMSVYYCPNTQYTSLIFLHELHKMKSYDAVVDDEPAFSDDEEERAYYEMLKQKNNKDSSDGSTSRKRQRMSSFTQDKPTAEWQSNHPWNRNAKFQKNQTKGQQLLRNNSHFNLSQYRPYSYNDSWMQYQYQNNMHWPPVPRNMHPIFNRSNAEYRPSFNESGLPQYGNYNSNNSGDGKQYFQGATPNSQCNNMQPQYSRIPFGAPPRFNPMFPPSLPISYPQLSNASFSCIDMSYPISVQPHTNALWPSLPPPPPPSKDSMTIDFNII
ncbi:H/ACA ribonucleoprotein complex non-core subunit NAF1 [Polyergus mexicanus]|uniref:H/ACA ribonucleoprotein complex non-core subunit NAF1 n=1 Tax=Polyergus mexicanus TaxID=615972 RepID=UPI0038B5711A